MTTSCTIITYDHRGRETGKRISLVSCSNDMVEIQIGLGDAVWVEVDELKRAVENMENSNKRDGEKK